MHEWREGSPITYAAAPNATVVLRASETLEWARQDDGTCFGRPGMRKQEGATQCVKHGKTPKNTVPGSPR